MLKQTAKQSKPRRATQTGNSASDKLPVELWLEVFRNISHPQTLAHIMQVSRQLCAIVEEQLYRSVDLAGQEQFSKFRLCLTSCPHRAPLVQDLCLSNLAEKNPDIPRILPPFLRSLRNLRRLAIEWKQQFGPGTACCDAVSCVRFPHLQSLRVLTRPDPGRFLGFLAAHAGRLEELEMTYTYPFEEPPVVDRLASITFPALRALECTTLFLGGHERVPVPPNLTCLYRPAFRESQLEHIAERLGTQLVSLRLGNRLQEDHEILPWTLRDVRTKLPRLRYLQVDMRFNRDQRVPTDVVDWFSDATQIIASLSRGSGTTICPSTSISPLSRSKITIAWGFFGLQAPRSDAEWNQFADKEAARVLKISGDYVERVLYRRYLRRFSVGLSASAEVREGREIIREEVNDDMERYWARV